MYKKILATLSLAITGMFTYAQTEVNHVCGTNLLFQQKVANNPALQQEYENLLKTAAVAQPNVEKAVRIIPVVFHIIHNGGDENISKAQIEDQIRILNEDYRRLNADAANTPSVWQSIAADANIEFRLANIDPSGNCTDGIVRIKSTLTNNASDDTGIKALSYWPRNKYLNIWVVKSIDNMGAAGVVLGYAQLPIQFFTANTDGIVLRSDVVGSIGTSLTGIDPQGKGRTATHEVGHWLGLRHIWGDSDCGDDFVNDTPVHQTANSGCPSFPKTNTCNGAGANGEMFMNYMDYTRGGCQNMFSAGQKSVFDLTLSSISFRASVIAQSNLTATGVLNSPPNTCAPKADFTTSDVFICSGSQIEFTDASWNGTPTQWNWQFAGGTPATSTAQNPTVTYNTPGIYNVTLTATNASGNNTVTKQAVVQVFSNIAEQQSVWNYTEPFEDQGYFDNSWFVVNTEGDNYKWQRTSNAGISQTGAAKMNNFGNSNADRVDELISPSFNFNSITNPVIKFNVAYCRVNNSANESLKLFLSSDCGQTWVQRYTKSASQLVTTSNSASPFTPTDNSQWRQETVSVSSSFNNQDNVRMKFVFTSDTEGNNLYIDNINIANPTGLDQAVADNLNFTVYPNPSNGNISVTYNLLAKARVEARVFDVVGREVKTIYQGNAFGGTNQLIVNSADFPVPGVYMLQLMVDNNRFVKQLVITE